MENLYIIAPNLNTWFPRKQYFTNQFIDLCPNLKNLFMQVNVINELTWIDSNVRNFNLQALGILTTLPDSYDYDVNLYL